MIAHRFSIVFRALLVGAFLMLATSVAAQVVFVDPGPAPTTREEHLARFGPDMPTYAEKRLDWNWGEMLYGRSYEGVLTLTNDCGTQRSVGIFRYGLPDLLIAPGLTLPPRRTITVPYRIDPAPQSAGSPRNLRGELAIWQPPTRDSECGPIRIVHVVTGSVRAPTPDEQRHEAEHVARVATESGCAVWWALGSNPGQDPGRVNLPDVVRRTVETLDEQKCASVVRPLARHYRQRLAEAHGAKNPDGWRWLPAAAALEQMSMRDLIAFRRRAEDLLAKQR